MMIISHIYIYIYISMGRLYCLEVMYYEWSGGGGGGGRVCCQKGKRKNLSNHHQTKQTARQLTH